MPTYNFSGASTFLGRDFFQRSLNLGNIQGKGLNWDRLTKDSVDLDHLVGITSHEHAWLHVGLGLDQRLFEIGVGLPVEAGYTIPLWA